MGTIKTVLGIEVARSSVDEGPAYGAAILAAVGAGLFDSVEEACARLIRTVDSRLPDPARSEVYRRLYDLYQPLYTTLKDFYDGNAAFVGDTMV